MDLEKTIKKTSEKKEDTSSLEIPESSLKISDIDVCKNCGSLESEILLTYDEMNQVLEEANYLNQLNIRKDLINQSVLIPENFKELEELRQKFSIEYIHSIANQLGIPIEYINKVINLKYPSLDQQIKELKDNEAAPSISFITKTVFSTYIAGIKEALENNYPFLKFNYFSRSRDYGSVTELNITHTEKHTKKNRKKGFINYLLGLFLGQEQTTIDLADIHMEIIGCEMDKNYSLDLYLNLHNPRFIHACGETINNISKKFEPYFKKINKNIVYDYVDFTEKKLKID